MVSLSYVLQSFECKLQVISFVSSQWFNMISLFFLFLWYYTDWGTKEPLREPNHFMWAPSSEFVSSSFPSWQILTAHTQPFRGARDLAFCLKVPLDSLLVWASSEGSGETVRMRSLAWTFAARIGDKYQIRMMRSNCIIVFWIIVKVCRLYKSFKPIASFTSDRFKALVLGLFIPWTALKIFLQGI